MKLHFSGIGGIGISALAQLCLARGDEISGSDLAESEIFPVLKKLKIPVALEQTAENISKNLDALIYSEAVPETNPERVRAEELNIPQFSYFEFLGKVAKNFRTIGIAGTHGKTSTTALFATASQFTKLDPTVVVGTILKEFSESNFHAGKSDWLVVEACEYRENFKFLEPEIVILTGIEHDHFDAFPTEESYFSAFENFVKNAKTVIFHAGDENAQKVLENFRGEKLAIPRQIDNSWKYLLKISGQYNYDNATLALAIAHKLDLNLEDFKKGLGEYRGAGRRQEFLGKRNGVNFFDDYAHHPSEISALLRGFREKFPAAKIGIIFEPHQHSRTRELLPEFVESLQIADEIGLFKIYPARDTNEDKKSMPDEKFRAAVSNSVPIDGEKDAEKFLEKFEPGDVVIFCGAGNISAFARKVLKN
ncbi:hypothetical protein HN954_03115 [bacterium]|nr:hypothetical protein [bacterium]MBT6832159.1 hypothetical protein [bacterium]MBT6996395.1 hypothetical protein [bacterium]MBT7772130.1 hypothetical protein [bacterium]